MKKIMTNTINKVLLLVLFITSQLTVFADTGTEGSDTRWEAVSHMPQFWIGVALFVLFVGLFIFSGKKRNGQVA